MRNDEIVAAVKKEIVEVGKILPDCPTERALKWVEEHKGTVLSLYHGGMSISETADYAIIGG